MRFKLERNEPENCYYYLDKKDSDLYDRFIGSKDPKDKIIVRLILDKAKLESGEHDEWSM